MPSEFESVYHLVSQPAALQESPFETGIPGPLASGASIDLPNSAVRLGKRYTNLAGAKVRINQPNTEDICGEISQLGQALSHSERGCSI
jgi:hypothetical protein